MVSPARPENHGGLHSRTHHASLSQDEPLSPKWVILDFFVARSSLPGQGLLSPLDDCPQQQGETGMNKLLSSTLLAAMLAVGTPALANDPAGEEAMVTSIDINTATQEQLALLTGVGPAKAAAIVEYRENNGPFASVDDLAKVSGIGPATVEKNRHLLSN